MRYKILSTICLLLLWASLGYSDSATWVANPVNAQWQDPLNWSPQTVPRRSGDVATFETSIATDIRILDPVNLASLVFNPGASAYTIEASGLGPLFFRDKGVINNSGVTQTFELTTVSNAYDNMVFFGHATAGKNVVYHLQSDPEAPSGVLNFWQNSSAGDATINLDGARRPSGTYEARIIFFHTTHAGHAHFTMEGGQVAYGDGGTTEFDCDGCSAEQATFIAQGSTINRGFGGEVVFNNTSNAADATLIANPGDNGGDGGKILFVYQSVDNNAQVQVFGSARLDISSHAAPGIAIGSIEGSGRVVLGANTLTVGGNGRDTIFSGSINEGPNGQGGSLVKIARGKLILTGSSSYRGTTTVSDGQLFANNKGGSATGYGPVIVNRGSLGGSGIVAGAVTIGSGTGGVGASLAPGRTHGVGTLTIGQQLTMNPYSAGEFAFDTDNAIADQVIANGVTIDSNAQFAGSAIGSGTVTTGTVFTVINNTAATPIAGTFGNLPDGATISIGNNHFQANYEGGDVNDLTLTVVP